MANDKHETLTERWLMILKNNPLVAPLIIISIAIAGISKFTEDFDKIYNYAFPLKIEKDFHNSIKKLNNSDVNERVNAIRDLKLISESDPSGKYRVEILDELSSLVRRRVPWKSGVINDVNSDINLKDVKSALETIAQIPKKDDTGKLHRINLTNIDISGLRLPPDPNLADLEGANLWASNLRNVVLAQANLKGTDLGGVDFTDASLEMANLEGSLLWRSDKVEPIRPSIFERTRLGAAILKDAHLEGALLSNAYDLSENQVRQAIINDNTRLPPGITVPRFPANSAR